MRDQITIYYNSQHPDARTLLSYAASLDVPLLAYDLCSDPLTPMQLLNFASRLNVPISDLVWKDKAQLLFSSEKELSVEDWACILQKEPSLFRKPIAERKNRIALLESSSDILNL
ncbi:MAG: hypothetical protein WEC59_01220 [Salibacteraceae bacterium]